METYEIGETAERTGIDLETLRRMVALGIIEPDADGRFTDGHVRRLGLVESLVSAGIPLDGLAAAIRNRRVSLDFLDAPAFARFTSGSGLTFAQTAERTGVPVELLTFIREAAGSTAPRPEDRIRSEELAYVDLVELTYKAGFHRATVQQMLRTEADCMRRLAETQAAMWQSEVVSPAMEAGKRPDEILGVEFGDRMSVLAETAMLAMYHMQQTKAWTAGIIEGLELQLAGEGLHTRLEHPPAMCFLDITGYTQLTDERGDAAAAALAEQLGRIVQRESVKHGGRAVKWLGDGVMLHFPNPGQGVTAALDMSEAVVDAGLPQAHVGLHAGPVIFQEGDYYGQTVNLAARIAAYARAGEVVASQAVVDASIGAAVAFTEIGPVKLKGVAGATVLHAARRPS